MEPALSSRKKQILKAIVEIYVKTAEPVGSKAIAAALKNSVSSATIRNEMAELEEQGYLEKPHTSAGRIPSPKCYRIYVNELMEQHRLSLQETESINEALHIKLRELDRVLSQAGQVVSRFTRYPAYTLAAGKKQSSIARFDLLSVDEQSFIAVVMTDDSRVKSKLLHAQGAVVPGVGQAAVDLRAGEHKAAALTQGDDFFHGFLGVFQHVSSSSCPAGLAAGRRVNLPLLYPSGGKSQEIPLPARGFQQIAPAAFVLGEIVV